MIEILPPMRVACYRAISRTPEQDAEQFLANWLITEAVNVPIRRFGFVIEIPIEQQWQGLRGYEAWVTIPNSVCTPAGVRTFDGVTIEEFHGGSYATLTISRPSTSGLENIPVGWKQLHHWVIESDCCRGANHQWLEEAIPNIDGNALKLYHPVILI